VPFSLNFIYFGRLENFVNLFEAENKEKYIKIDDENWEKATLLSTQQTKD
jgi:hypothetical protein